MVCTNGSTFSINIPAADTIDWSISGSNFSLSNVTNTSVSVTKTGLGNSSATLTALFNGVIPVTKEIIPCQTTISQSYFGPICSASYSINNLPSHILSSQVNWTCSSNLEFVGSTTGYTATVKAIHPPSHTATGWVKIQVGGETISCTIHIMEVSPYANIEGSSTLGLGSSANYTLCDWTYPYIEPEDPQAGCFIVSFISSENLSVSFTPPLWLTLDEDPPEEENELEEEDPPGGRMFDDPEPEEPTEPVGNVNLTAQVTALDCGPGWVTARIKINGQLYTVTKYITVTGCGGRGGLRSARQEPVSYASGYPNPVSDVLFVEIDQKTYSAFKSTWGKTENDIVEQADPVFHVYLYNSLGQLKLRTTTQGKAQLNVSQLPEGIYFLHINDSSGEKALVRKIRVKR